CIKGSERKHTSPAIIEPKTCGGTRRGRSQLLRTPFWTNYPRAPLTRLAYSFRRFQKICHSAFSKASHRHFRLALFAFLDLSTFAAHRTGYLCREWRADFLQADPRWLQRPRV